MTCQSRSQTTPQCWLTFSSRVSVDWLIWGTQCSLYLCYDLLTLNIWSRYVSTSWDSPFDDEGRGRSRGGGRGGWRWKLLWMVGARPGKTPGGPRQPDHQDHHILEREVDDAKGEGQQRKSLIKDGWQLFQVLPPNCRVLARWAHHRNLGIFGSSGQQPEVMFPKW